MSRVLITKNITPQQLRLIMDAELLFEIETAVEFSIEFNTNQVIQSIKDTSDWLFTSINAVKSIQPLLSKYQNKFEQKIYCIGKGTRNHLSNLGYYSIETYKTMNEMKEELDWDQAKNITYFCNNISENVIPKGVDKSLHKVEYVQVFKTSLLNPPITNTDFDFVFYFSPLGARSILENNPKLKTVKSLCTGPSTLRYLEQNGVKNCHAPDNANFKTMVEYVIKSFKTDRT